MYAYEQTAKNNLRVAKESAKKRAILLAQLPEQFQAKDAIVIWGIHQEQAYHQIKKMVQHGEISVAASGYPKTYRKAML